MVRDDQLAFLQELVGHAYAFAQQAARILPEVQNQAFEVAHLIERFTYFVLSRFLEAGDVHVAYARPDHEMEINAVAGNLVANNAELERMVSAFPQHGDTHCGALGPFEQVGDVGGAHIVGRLAVDGGDDIAGPNAGSVGWGTDERGDYDDLIIARADRHADAVILAALLLAKLRIRLWIKEIGVRVELVQHARDGSVVDGLVGIHRVGVVLFDRLIHFGELLEAVANVGVRAGRRRGRNLLGKKHAEQAEQRKDENYKEERTTRTTGHVSKSSGRHRGGIDPPLLSAV